MTGIVLAGGASKRMGTDKAFLKVAGIPLIERVLQSLKPLCGTLVIVANEPHRYAGFSAEVVTDVFEQRGPLTGIYSGLLRSSDDCNIVVACDMPCLNRELLAFMAGQSDGHDAVIASFNGFLEPLHAVYRRTALPVIETQIKTKGQRIREIYDRLRVRYITEQEIDRFDPLRRSFTNLNTMKEYEEAACAD